MEGINDTCRTQESDNGNVSHIDVAITQFLYFSIMIYVYYYEHLYLKWHGFMEDFMPFLEVWSMQLIQLLSV
jgi:hypothetical protein